MRRADRLLELIQILRDGKLHRAQNMARTLGVSERTIYRDMDTLVASGTPVCGERGVGYQMTVPITLPPMNLSMRELEVLNLGVAILTEAADEELQLAAKSLAGKIDAVLPENQVAAQTAWGFAVYPFADAATGFKHIPMIRGAIRDKTKITVLYEDLEGHTSRSVFHPLQLDYWGRVWTLTAWSESQFEFCVLRVDRIRELAHSRTIFTDQPGKSLQDYIAGLADTSG